MNVAAPPMRPPKTASASVLTDVIAAMRSGRTLILSSDTISGVGGAALAAQALLRAIDYFADEDRHTLLVGSPPALHGVSDEGTSPIRHELRWLSAGDLHERILALPKRSESVSHVVYLDPWAVGLDRVRIGQHSQRLLIADFTGQETGTEAEYWKAYTAWLAVQGVDLLIAPSLLIDQLPATFWRPPRGSSLTSVLPTFDPAGPRVVVEESEQRPPSVPGLHRLVSELGPAHHILLITPHLTTYREECPDDVNACVAAWHPADLAVPMYTTLVASADLYVAPTGLAPGTHRLRALRDNAQVIVEGDDIPDWLRERAKPSAVPVLSLRPIPSVRVAATATVQNIEPFASWWAGLAQLQTNTPAAAPVETRAKADFAILVCCYKFLQRFRIFMQSIACQTHPLERIEVCVAAPGNPDGLYEYMQLLEVAHPTLSLKLVKCPESDKSTKGKLVNAAYRESIAPVVMVADGDLVLPRDFVASMLAEHRPSEILGCWRTPLTRELTAHIVTGNLDPIEHFEMLRQQWSTEEKGEVRQGLLGYCQILAREAFGQVMYPEEFDGFGQSDIVFLERLQQRLGLTSRFLKDRFVLHLSHHRDWTGTKVFL